MDASEVDVAIIRPARGDDAPLLSRLAAQTFSETFAHLYPPADLAAFIAETYRPDAFARDLADREQAIWLMEARGAAIGYAQVGPCGLPHPEVTAQCGELKRIYLQRRWQGGGRGSRLLATALDWLEQSGRRRIWLGVWSGNAGAQRLYAARGFAKVGDYEFAVGAVRDHEFIFRRG